MREKTLKKLIIERYNDQRLLEKYYDKKVLGIERYLINKYIANGSRVLDVGCGTGRLLIELARKKCRVTGLDISKSMLSIARKKLRKEGIKAELINKDITKFKKPACFDAILILGNTWEQIPPSERDIALRNIYESLKPRGVLLLNTESIFYPELKTWSKILIQYFSKKNKIKDFCFGDVILKDELGLETYLHISNPFKLLRKL
ncbi:class I SAM-dependent methyltransferase, partial [Candidatus Woesearchaeota archaeon]|nr:class I SAM-dependent methyltransferase [Candidatus Woesearchaeota archaeon]